MKNKELRVIVTIGDTYEAIDEVRRITHMATGRLGSLIADEFARAGANVTCICGERSMRPSEPMEKIIEITGVEALKQAMESLLHESKYNCVVHSMAVSDYTVRGLVTESDMVTGIVQAICALNEIPEQSKLASIVENAILRAQSRPSGKISSDLDSLAVFLDRAPKVISSVKEIQPDITLVGFKLLAGVAEEELMQAAQRQIKASRSDFVFANDLSTISGDGHCGMLINNRGDIISRPANKQDIAKTILENVLKKINGDA